MSQGMLQQMGSASAGEDGMTTGGIVQLVLVIVFGALVGAFLQFISVCPMTFSAMRMTYHLRVRCASLIMSGL